MYTYNDLVAALQSGVSVEDIAAQMSKDLNAAKAEYEGSLKGAKAEADKIIDQPLLAFDSRIAQHHVATHKGLTHHCQPLLRGGLGIGRGEQDMLVTGRLDTHVDGHLHRDGETRVVLYLCYNQIGPAQAHVR